MIKVTPLFLYTIWHSIFSQKYNDNSVTQLQQNVDFTALLHIRWRKSRPPLNFI